MDLPIGGATLVLAAGIFWLAVGSKAAMIIVLGNVALKPGKLAEAMLASQAHVDRSHLEPGCIEHRVSIDGENPDRLIFVERWADIAALKVHFRLAASRSFVGALAAIAISPPSMLIYEADELAPPGRGAPAVPAIRRVVG